MQKIQKICAFLAAVWFFSGTFAFSQYFDQDPGTPIYGPPLKNEDLVGKVVYIEYWGIHCGPCRAAFPHLIECQAAYGRSGGFVLIGSHLQEPSPEVAEYLRSVNCNFTNYQQYRCPLAPPQAGGIPQAYLLDCRGQLAASGHPQEVLQKVGALVEEAVQRRRLMEGFNPAMLVDLPPEFQKLPALFTAEKSWNAPMKQLEKKGRKSDEAKAVLESLHSAIDEEIESLASARKEKPVETLYRLTRLSKNLKGLPQLEKVNALGKKAQKVPGAKEMQKVWVQMENFQKKCQAGKLKPAAALKEAKRIAKSFREASENEDFHKAVRSEMEAMAELIENQLAAQG